MIEVRSGKSSAHHLPAPPGLIHLRPMNIGRDGQLDLSSLKYVQETYPGEFPRLRHGDILFNNTNSAALVGKTSTIDTSRDWSYSNHMTVLRVPPDFSPRFLALQIHYLWMTGHFHCILKQYINQASVSKRVLTERVVLAIPPASEQSRIANKVDQLFARLNDSISSLRRAERKTSVLMRSVIRSAVTAAPLEPESAPTQHADSDLESKHHVTRDLPSSDLRDLELLSSEVTVLDPTESTEVTSDEVSPPHLPDGWDWTPIEDIGEVCLGRQRAPKYHGGPHPRPYLRVANVLEDRIKTADIKTMNFDPDEFLIYRLQPGDILVNEGQSSDLVGRPAMFRGEVPNACFQNTLIRFRANDRVDPEFALLVFRYYLHSGRFRRVARWSTNIAHLGLKRFASMRVPLPPMGQQKKLVAITKRRLSHIGTQGETISSLLKKAQELRRSILADAFAGRLVPQLPAEGSGEELIDNCARDRRSTIAQTSTKGRRSQRLDRGGAVTKRVHSSIHDALVESGGRLATYDLFKRCGFAPETIDGFYEELKQGIRGGRIRESREPDTAGGDDVHPSYIELVR